MKGIVVCNDGEKDFIKKGGDTGSMNRNLLIGGIIIAALVVGGVVYSTSKSNISSQQVAQAPKPTEPMKKEEAKMMGVGYILKNGKMMVDENEKLSPMTADVTLKDGTVVTIAGQVTKKDGTTFTLTEGQSMWTDGTFMKAEAMMKDGGMNSDASALSTRYIDYSPENLAKAGANNGKAVLFFAALKWCPSCQAADKDFKANFDKVPKDITILKVDYDNDSTTKQKYAISMQDTFVEIDNQGKEITRWNSGGQGVAALLANAK